MRSPFVDFTDLVSANNSSTETTFEFESPFADNENYSAELENSYLSDEADFEQPDTEIADELSNDLIADEMYPLLENSTQQIEGPDPGISKEVWEMMGESIEYDVPKAATSKDIAAQVSKYFSVSTKVITSYDWAFQRPWSDRFKELVEWAAAQVNLNPGLVAVNFITETRATDYLGGTISSFVVGTDDFYDKRTAVEKKVPAFKDISWKRDSAYLTDVNEKGRTVNTVYFKSGKDAALANAVYLKHGEEVLREEAARLGKKFDDIPLERCFAFLRLAFNAGNGRAKKNLNQYFSKNQDILILKPQQKAGPQRMATIRTAQAIYLSETFFAQPLNLVLKEAYDNDQQMENYSISNEQVNFEELVSVANPPSCNVKATKKNKINFEFDMLLNITSDTAKFFTLGDGVLISEHTRSANGFKLKIDGNKIELNTALFKLTDPGLVKLKTAFANIRQWLDDLETAFKTHGKKDKIKKTAACTSCPSGEGIFIETKTVGKALKIKDEFITANHFIMPLKWATTNGHADDMFTNKIAITGVPQVTMGIPLSSVNKLVDEIYDSKFKGIGKALTAISATNRMGIRSVTLFNAQYRVNETRAFWIKKGNHNSLKITTTNFSETLTGFMILLVQYLWTNVVPYNLNDDTEGFSKAYIPLHSKTRFREMFHCLLNDAERELFIKVFWENDNWKNLFSLTKKISRDDCSRCYTNSGGYTDINTTPDITLFPEQVFSSITWKDFVTSIVENKFTIENTDASGNATLATGPTDARPLESAGVTLELRRMGFGVLSSDKWQAMAERLFDIARKLN